MKRLLLLTTVCGLLMQAQTVVSPGQDIQAAINAAPSGGTVVLNAGTYSVPATLQISRPLTLRNQTGGVPVLQLPNGTVVGVDVKSGSVTLEGFRITDPGWGIYAGDGSTPMTNIVIRGVSVNATGANSGHGIYTTNAPGVLVESCVVEFATFNGILIENSAGAVLRSNTIQNTGSPDAAIKISNTAGSRLFSNTVQNTGANAHGILLMNSTDGVLDGNTIQLADANGILADAGSHRATIINNTIVNTNTQHGIAVKVSDAAIVAGNRITGANQFGIILLGSRNSKVERNSITGAKQDGIVVTDEGAVKSAGTYVGRNFISSNGLAVHNPTGTGIWLNNQSNGSLVYGNTTSGAPENGLTIFNSQNNHFWGNVTTSNGEGGIFIYGPLPGELSYSSGPAPDYTVIQGNYAFGLPHNAGVNLNRATHNTVFNNMVRTSPIGIFLQTTSGNQLYLNMSHSDSEGVHAKPAAQSSTYFLNRHLNPMLTTERPATRSSSMAAPPMAAITRPAAECLPIDIRTAVRR